MVETSKGTVMGTFAPICPEQLAGLALDRQTDIFSFGCVLFEMLTGRQPFEGDSEFEVLAKVLEREPLSLRELEPDLPRCVEQIVKRSLLKMCTGAGARCVM